MKIIGFLLVLTGLLAGCGGSAVDESSPDAAPAKTEEAPEPIVVTGAIVANDFDWDYVENKLEDGEWCTGRHNYSDLQEGAQVVVKDGEGTKVGLSTLGAGVMTSGAKRCTWEFEVPDVPAGGGVYSLDVAGYVDMGSFTEEQGEEGLVLKVTVD